MGVTTFIDIWISAIAEMPTGWSNVTGCIAVEVMAERY